MALRDIGYFIRREISKREIQVVRGPNLNTFLETRRINTVLDVGANVGQFAKYLRNIGYRDQIVSFEPVTATYEELLSNSEHDPLWSARRLGLSNVAGPKKINVTKVTEFSSLVPQLSAATELTKGAEIVGTETIEIVRLDDIFEEFGSRRVLLKIDTQGSEQAVIEGASNSLKSILGVQLELPIEHLYENTWTIDEAIGKMRRYGFKLAQTSVVNVMTHDRASAVEFDCLFRRV
jgi:FkbM family methyltransferase